MSKAKAAAVLLIANIGKSYERKVTALRDCNALNQEMLLHVFQESIQEHQAAFTNTLVFQSAVKKAFYDLVNITPESTKFSVGDKEYSFHPRLLLWNGNPSCAHAHPADGKLQEDEISCVYYPVTPGVAEVIYSLQQEDQGRVKKVKILPTEDVGVDKYKSNLGERFAHSFIPGDKPVLNIKVQNAEGWETQVYAVTANLYNAAEPSQPAASTVVRDTNLPLTNEGLKTATMLQKILTAESKIVLVPAEEEGFKSAKEMFKISKKSTQFHPLKERGAMDDASWSAHVTRENRATSLQRV